MRSEKTNKYQGTTQGMMFQIGDMWYCKYYYEVIGTHLICRTKDGPKIIKQVA